MTETAIELDQVRVLLAHNGYDVSAQNQQVLKISEVDSGVTIRAVLEGNILYFSLPCTVIPEKAITAALMRKMLAGDNGISTSYFQLYPAGDGKMAITLSNFCKLQDMGPEDEDDILSCVHFLLVDVMQARTVIGDVKA